MNRVSAAFLSVFALSVFCTSGQCRESRNYQFGAFPYLPVERLDKIWSPVVNDLARTLNWKIQFRSRPGYAQFRDDVTNGVFDIVYLQPFAYVRAGAHNGYLPLVRFVSPGDKENSGMLRAIIVVLHDSPYRSAKDLKGKIIAMPPRDAAVSLLANAYLRDAGLRLNHDYRVNYHLNHTSCLRQLVLRRAQACVAGPPPYERFKRTAAVKTRKLAQTREIPSSLLAVRKTLPLADREKLRQYFLHLEGSAVGRKFLHEAGLRGFVVARDADYDVVRKIWSNTKSR